jgi:hypothetical protein
MADPDAKDPTIAVAVDDSASQGSSASKSWTTTRIELWSFYLYYVVCLLIPNARNQIIILRSIRETMASRVLIVGAACGESVLCPLPAEIYLNCSWAEPISEFALSRRL